MPHAAAPLFDLVGPTGDAPTFLTPAADGLPDALDRVLSTPHEVVKTQLEGAFALAPRVPPWVRELARGERAAQATLARALHATYHGLLAPEQQNLHAGFHHDQAWRARTLATSGIHTMLSTIPGNRWTGQALENDECTTPEINLAGRGITLLPSATWTGGALLDTLPDGTWLLIYATLDSSAESGPHTDDSLTALLGRTRAAILRLTTHPHTTTGVAAALRISPASASEHTTVLRRTGLIASHRTGKSVLHARTPLGDQLTAQHI